MIEYYDPQVKKICRSNTQALDQMFRCWSISPQLDPSFHHCMSIILHNLSLIDAVLLHIKERKKSIKNMSLNTLGLNPNPHTEHRISELSIQVQNLKVWEFVFCFKVRNWKFIG